MLSYEDNTPLFSAPPWEYSSVSGSSSQISAITNDINVLGLQHLQKALQCFDLVQIEFKKSVDARFPILVPLAEQDIERALFDTLVPPAVDMGGEADATPTYEAIKSELKTTPTPCTSSTLTLTAMADECAVLSFLT